MTSLEALGASPYRFVCTQKSLLEYAQSRPMFRGTFKRYGTDGISCTNHTNNGYTIIRMTPVPNSADWEVCQWTVKGDDPSTNILAMEIAIATEPPTRIELITPNNEIRKAIEKGNADMFSPESGVLSAVRRILTYP